MFIHCQKQLQLDNITNILTIPTTHVDILHIFCPSDLFPRKTNSVQATFFNEDIRIFIKRKASCEASKTQTKPDPGHFEHVGFAHETHASNPCAFRRNCKRSAGPLVGHTAVEAHCGSKYQVYKYRYQVQVYRY